MKTKEIIKITRKIAGPFRVTKGESFRLKDVDPNDTLEFTKEEHKPAAKDALAMEWQRWRICRTNFMPRIGGRSFSSFKLWMPRARMAPSNM